MHRAIASGSIQCAATTQLFQHDKSYGADGMAERGNIASIKKLKGKTVAASSPDTAPDVTKLGNRTPFCKRQPAITGYGKTFDRCCMSFVNSRPLHDQDLCHLRDAEGAAGRGHPRRSAGQRPRPWAAY